MNIMRTEEISQAKNQQIVHKTRSFIREFS